MSGVEIVPVQTRSDMKAFIDLPWKIYQDYTNWVPPLKSEVRKLLDTRKHPFWKFSERVLFLARRGREVMGRIAAIVDGNYNEYHSDKMGAWGFFECIEDEEVSEALFRSAEQWLRQKGMTFMRGPLNPSTNYDVGMLIEGFQYPPVIMMPYNPPYYLKLAESSGFEKEKDLLAFHLEQGDEPSDRFKRLVERIRGNNSIRVKLFDFKRLAQEALLFKEIYDDAWSDNWGFVPMTNDEMLNAARELSETADPDFCFFIYRAEQPVGAMIALPDPNPILKRLNGKVGLFGLLKLILYRREIKGGRVLLFGVKKEFQKLGLLMLALDHVMGVFRKKKETYQHAELGWTIEDNASINQVCYEGGAQLYKRYRVFRKPL
jgi:hypothetical protein